VTEQNLLIRKELTLFFLSAKQKRQMEAQNGKKTSGLVLDNGQKLKGEGRLGDN
jgi:hypothetical protein